MGKMDKDEDLMRPAGGRKILRTDHTSLYIGRGSYLHTLSQFIRNDRDIKARCAIRGILRRTVR